jgi:flagellar protein FlaI
MLDGIKSMRGALYKKIKQRNMPKHVSEKGKTRARQMMTIINDCYGRSTGKYPKFKILPTKLITTNFSGKMITYSLIRPYAYATIRWSAKENDMVYNVVEPLLHEDEKRILDKIKEGMIQTIDVSIQKITKEDGMLDFIEKHVQKLLKEYGFELSSGQYNRIMYYIYRDFIGLNEIEPLLEDPYIEDISCDGVDIPIFVVHRHLGSIKTNLIYKDEKKLKEFVIKLAERSDRYISYADPLLDGSLPDGTRIQASLAGDVTTKGPTFSIRKFPERPMTPVNMIKLGTASAEMLAYLWLAVENEVNVLIAGGTATGKTTFLNALSLFIPPDKKIVSIEDTRELSLPHENWIPGVARLGFIGTDVGEVSMYDLLKESFRQNPDYLIVGEVRGEEANVMFQGMASGHASISTIHAGSIDDVIKRLITKPLSLPSSLVEALDLVIIMTHARSKGEFARRVKEIEEIGSGGEKQVSEFVSDIPHKKSFIWNPAKDSYSFDKSAYLLEKISGDKGIPINKIKKEIAIREQILKKLVEKDVKEWKNVVNYFSLYSKDPDKVKKMLGM